MSKPKPIAYELAAKLVCPGCEPEFSREYFARTHCRPSWGALFYPGAEREQLRGKVCEVCKLTFNADPNLRVWGGHADNGWQFHYSR